MSIGSISELARRALAEEVLALEVYARLAKLSRSISTKLKFAKISEIEGKHAGFWSEFLRKRGYDVSSAKQSRLKVSLYVAFLGSLGFNLTMRLSERSEQNAIEQYSGMIERQELDDTEKSEIGRIIEDELVHEQEFAEETRFKESMKHVRDAVLGVNDGLVEILSITTGFAGAYGNPFQVVIGGLIVSIAGAMSMGIGTFASVRAQRHVHLGLLQRTKLASRYVAHLLKDRIGRHMVEKGYSRDLSGAIADESSKNHRLLSKVIAEEEHGLRETDFSNPRKAGLYSGFSNLLGAFVPLIPYLFGIPIHMAVLLSLLLVGAALAFTGFLIAVLANLPIRRRMLEMMVVGLGSAGASFLVGRVASTFSVIVA